MVNVTALNFAESFLLNSVYVYELLSKNIKRIPNNYAPPLVWDTDWVTVVPISVHELEIVLCLPYVGYKPQARFVLFLCCYFAANKDRLYSHKQQRTEFPVQTRSILYPPAPPHKSEKQLQVICTQNRAKQLLQKPKPLILTWVALNFTQ